MAVYHCSTLFSTMWYPLEVTGDTCHLVLYLCTERTPQHENRPLGQMKFTSAGSLAFPLALGIDFFFS